MGVYLCSMCMCKHIQCVYMYICICIQYVYVYVSPPVDVVRGWKVGIGGGRAHKTLDHIHIYICQCICTMYYVQCYNDFYVHISTSIHLHILR